MRNHIANGQVPVPVRQNPVRNAPLLTSDFDYDLPEGLIARQPAPERDAARLLRVPLQGKMHDLAIRDLPSLVQTGDVWVLNDTRVIPARLLGRKDSGGRVEILLLEPLGDGRVWQAWGRPGRQMRPGTIIRFAEGFSGEVLVRRGKHIHIHLLADDVAQAIEAHGHMPLPPYIDRPDDATDKQRYQTVYARHRGAVAAPTAGLHLTRSLLIRMQETGAEFVHVTLHVGAGTFDPVRSERVEAHEMHEEAYDVPEQTAAVVNKALTEGRRVVAVGTTSLRTLEAACVNGRVAAGSGRTSLFIYPGYQFRAVGALLTNFHLPRSTLLMLVCALAGRDRVMAAYTHAINERYRFYSYGDAMLVG